jgi:CRP/FNR family cyclic AMP-dependent transcriptional regulator
MKPKPRAPKPSRRKGQAGFEDLIRRLAQGGSALRAMESGQVDAIIDPTTGKAILLHKAQEALCESEARFRAIFEYAKDVMYTVEPDGTFSFISPAIEPISGWSSAEWIGRPFASIVHPDDRPRALEIFNKALSGQATSLFEMRMARKSGSYWDAQISTVPLISHGTTVMLGVGHDVSERKAVLANVGEGRIIAEYGKNHAVFSQGDTADALFYIQKGKIKLSISSPHGKEAVVAILGTDDFFGEGCLAGQPLRMATAKTMTECTVVRLEKNYTIRVLHEQPEFSELFLSYMLSRSRRLEEDLVDQLFNSSEKRLARVLLQLANFGKEGKPDPVIPKISQETLAEIIGTTRSRVSFFMNKFRKLGLIEYKEGMAGLQVHSALLNVVLHD